MTAGQFAGLVNARRIGRGKWVAKCPAHPDRHPSMSIAEGKRAVLVRCMSHGCETKSILDALGLKWSDLFYDEKVPQQVRARTSLQEQRANLERQLGLAIWLGAVERGRRRYWAAAERRIKRELLAVRCRIEPLEVYREERGRRWQCMNATQRERALEIAYGVYRAAEGARQSAGEVR